MNLDFVLTLLNRQTFDDLGEDTLWSLGMWRKEEGNSGKYRPSGKELQHTRNSLCRLARQIV